MKYSAIAVLAALVLSSTPAFARHHYRNHDPRVTHQDIAAVDKALEERDDTLQRHFTMRVGAAERDDIAGQRREIRELRHQLKRGQPIDGYALYHALGGSSYPIYFAS